MVLNMLFFPKHAISLKHLQGQNSFKISLPKKGVRNPTSQILNMWLAVYYFGFHFLKPLNLSPQLALIQNYTLGSNSHS